MELRCIQCGDSAEEEGWLLLSEICVSDRNEQLEVTGRDQILSGLNE